MKNLEEKIGEILNVIEITYIDKSEPSLSGVWLAKKNLLQLFTQQKTEWIKQMEELKKELGVSSNFSINKCIDLLRQQEE